MDSRLAQHLWLFAEMTVWDLIRDSLDELCKRNYFEVVV